METAWRWHRWGVHLPQTFQLISVRSLSGQHSSSIGPANHPTSRPTNFNVVLAATPFSNAATPSSPSGFIPICNQYTQRDAKECVHLNSIVPNKTASASVAEHVLIWMEFTLVLSIQHHFSSCFQLVYIQCAYISAESATDFEIILPA